MFKLEIQTDNAAFDHNPGHEIARLLHAVAVTMSENYPPPHAGQVPDANGNTCCHWSWGTETALTKATSPCGLARAELLAALDYDEGRNLAELAPDGDAYNELWGYVKKAFGHLQDEF